MRRKDREIADFTRVIEILRACDIATIAMSDEDGLPYCVPVNFGFTAESDSLTLYFHGAKEGKKADILKKGPPVSVCIYRNLGILTGDAACDYGIAFESVMAFGHAFVLTGGEQRRKGLAAIMEKVSDRELPYEEAVLSRTAVFAVQVDRWTAKQRVPKPGDE